jgi:hypothetical protein
VKAEVPRVAVAAVVVEVLRVAVAVAVLRVAAAVEVLRAAVALPVVVVEAPRAVHLRLVIIRVKPKTAKAPRTPRTPNLLVSKSKSNLRYS